MNKWQRYQILRVSFLVAGVGAIMLPGNVDAAKSAMEACLTGGNSKAECECEAAMKSGSEKALRSFLKRYPSADTICNATASTGVVVDRDDTNLDGPNPGDSSGTPGGGTPGGGTPGGGTPGGGTPGGTSNGINNGHGNLDQSAPGNSESHNNAENSGNSGQGNSGTGGGGHSF